MKKFCFPLFCLILSGCAFIDQNLWVDPHLAVSSSEIGGGKKIAIRAIDDRDEQLIGRRAGESTGANK